MEKIGEAGADFRSPTEHVDTVTPAGWMMMQMVGAFAEFERAMVRERTSAGLAAARAEGRIGGVRARSSTTPSAARSRRPSCRAGRPQRRWRGCSVCHRRPIRGSSPLIWRPRGSVCRRCGG
jgi:DNA invertase Pin-like site-specific DNA recombinase